TPLIQPRCGTRWIDSVRSGKAETTSTEVHGGTAPNFFVFLRDLGAAEKSLNHQGREGSRRDGRANENRFLRAPFGTSVVNAKSSNEDTGLTEGQDTRIAFFGLPPLLW